MFGLGPAFFDLIKKLFLPQLHLVPMCPLICEMLVEVNLQGRTQWPHPEIIGVSNDMSVRQMSWNTGNIQSDMHQMTSCTQ